MNLRIIDTKTKPALENMAFDEDLLSSFENEAILHFYEWENPSITYGYFVKVNRFIDLKKVKELGIDLARRPTGGGIVFHLWDFAFSFLLSKKSEYYNLNPLKNYEFVNSLTFKSIKKFLKKDEKYFLKRDEFFNEKKEFDNFCMAKPTKYDIVIDQKKILGASQRRKEKGFLHQASINLVPPDINIIGSVLKDKDIAKAIFQNSFFLFDKENLLTLKKLIKIEIIETFTNFFYSK
jgi:lipoate---protein ligase